MHTQRDTEPSSRLRHEPRNDSGAVPVRLPFRLHYAGHTFEGGEISLHGLTIDHYVEDLGVGEAVWANIALRDEGWTLTLPVQLSLEARHPSRGTSTFEILEMDEDDREALRRVLRARLTGERIVPEELRVRRRSVGGHRKRWSRGPATRQPIGTRLRLAGLGAAALVLLGVLGLSIYERLTTVEARFAAVTAPMVVLRAPASGQLAAHDLDEGDRVERDQKLTQVDDDDLLAELVLARATFEYNQKLLENIAEHVATLTESGGGLVTVDGMAEPIKLAEARVRMGELESALDLERARIRALELQLLGNSIHAPCDCLVRWARPATGQEWVQKGDQLFTLVNTDPGELMIEALVHMSDVDRIAPHQRAYVELPNRADPVPARVHAIALEGEHEPRAGFPEWLREDESLASVLLVPGEVIPAQYIGVPARVRFSTGAAPDGLVAAVLPERRFSGYATAEDRSHTLPPER